MIESPVKEPRLEKLFVNDVRFRVTYTEKTRKENLTKIIQSSLINETTLLTK